VAASTIVLVPTKPNQADRGSINESRYAAPSSRWPQLPGDRKLRGNAIEMDPGPRRVAGDFLLGDKPRNGYRGKIVNEHRRKIIRAGKSVYGVAMM
jgi:hypothetical protein